MVIAYFLPNLIKIFDTDVPYLRWAPLKDWWGITCSTCLNNFCQIVMVELVRAIFVIFTMCLVLWIFPRKFWIPWVMLVKIVGDGRCPDGSNICQNCQGGRNSILFKVNLSHITERNVWDKLASKRIQILMIQMTHWSLVVPWKRNDPTIRLVYFLCDLRTLSPVS